MITNRVRAPKGPKGPRAKAASFASCSQRVGPGVSGDLRSQGSQRDQEPKPRKLPFAQDTKHILPGFTSLPMPLSMRLSMCLSMLHFFVHARQDGSHPFILTGAGWITLSSRQEQDGRVRMEVTLSSGQEQTLSPAHLSKACASHLSCAALKQLQAQSKRPFRLSRGIFHPQGDWQMFDKVPSQQLYLFNEIKRRQQGSHKEKCGTKGRAVAEILSPARPRIGAIAGGL
eukprot:1150371-Pelagomonas_calceolata.AAC.1